MILNPEETLKPLFLRDDSRIADFGAGSGGFTVAASQYLHTGKIYAIDIQRGLLPLIARKIQPDKKKNIEIVWGDVEELGGSRLRSDSVDTVILANTLFQIKDKQTTLEEIKRVLINGGRVLLVDWTESFGNIGPHEDHVIRAEDARNLFESNGFVFDSEVPAGDCHYGIIFNLSHT